MPRYYLLVSFWSIKLQESYLLPPFQWKIFATIWINCCSLNWMHYFFHPILDWSTNAQKLSRSEKPSGRRTPLLPRPRTAAPWTTTRSLWRLRASPRRPRTEANKRKNCRRKTPEKTRRENSRILQRRATKLGKMENEDFSTVSWFTEDTH